MIAEAGGQIPLRIGINKKNLFPLCCERYTEIEGGDRLADAAFLIADGNGFTIWHTFFISFFRINNANDTNSVG